MSSEKILSSPEMGRSIIQHDERSRSFPASALFDTKSATRHNRSWRRGGAYDQGSTSSCVGQTMKGMLNTAPNTTSMPYKVRTGLDALEIYRAAQKLDEWEGEDYDGTSALGACRYLKERQLIQEYRWCFSLDDMVDTVVHVGPVGIGVWWYNGMFYPTDRGFIIPTGHRVGGHEVEVTGVHIADKYFVITNSWGTSWGLKGRAKISWDDMDSLLHQSGDAVVFVR